MGTSFLVILVVRPPVSLHLHTDPTVVTDFGRTPFCHLPRTVPLRTVPTGSVRVNRVIVSPVNNYCKEVLRRWRESVTLGARETLTVSDDPHLDPLSSSPYGGTYPVLLGPRE